MPMVPREEVLSRKPSWSAFQLEQACRGAPAFVGLGDRMGTARERECGSTTLTRALFLTLR